MNSIQYYNDNSKKFIEGTLQANMKQHYRDFLEHLSPSCKILDFGCGSGRDSFYFYKLGYDVTSLDGSIEMVNYCKKTLSNTIIHSTFNNYQSNVLFDGIWACDSLLHVEGDKLVEVIIKYLNI